MKKWIRRIMARAIAAMLLAGAAVAEKETFSEGFRLPNIQVRPTAPAEEPAQSEEVEAEKTVLGNAVVTLSDAGSSLNIRAQASKDSEKVGALSNGEEVFILGTSGEWTNIRTANGVEGYVMRSYLSEGVAGEQVEDEEFTEEEMIAEDRSEAGEDAGTPIAELIDAEYSDRIVRIYADWDRSKEYLEIGDKMVFTVELIGYDGLSYQIQWQTSTTGSGDWIDIAGATGQSYTLVLSQQNYDDYFRAIVNVTGLEG